MSEKNIQIDSNENKENILQRPEKSFLRKNLPIIGAVVGVVVVGIVIGLIPVYKSTSGPSTQIVDSTQSSIVPVQTSTSTSSFTPTTTTSSSTTTASTTSTTTTSTKTTTTTSTTTSTTTTSTTTITTSTTTTTIQTCIIKTDINSVYPSDYNSNSCPNNYFAEPNNLTLTDSYYFNYPVVQVIYCYGTKVSLQCPSNQVLKFLAVYYGIQPNTNTNFCRLGFVQHDACYWVPENIVRGCEGEQKCEIEVKDGLLGDPCKGSNNHQLFFQYQCIDLDKFDQINACSKNITKKSICSPLTPGAQNNFWCENEVQINCPSGLIRILCAFYGIDPNFKICPKGFYTGSPDTCYSSESQAYMETICNGRTSCRIANLDRNIPDYLKVCSGYQNILYAEWECVASLITTTTQAPSTVSTLPFCPFEQNLSGICVSEKFSPHVPVELVNSTSSYFGFPTVEYTLCQDSIMVLTCPTDLVIHIHTAYFGIQPNTSRSLCMSDSELPVCYTNTGYETILRACEAKSSCSLLATANTIAGVDLCPSHSKQLFVQYQCVDAIGWNKTISKCQVNADLPEICPAFNETENVLEQTWCEDSDMSIECLSGRIEVVCAFYGLHPSVAECGNLENINFKPVCYFESSFNYIDVLCSNQTKCEISDYSVFSDPCTHFQKAIYVQWKCV
ncbi:hypothetical protein BpHYR1_015227 [Brachionus plicatilis]|uniref:SUEL-type lectin domain-containing protein n=1 Tax=Brachionus plicatilis TaxID=10195 RepID=A0A3M7RBN0_BRAPC|nr:hypothetical protein BpHYR1_015227 [Brachionus plicatilis]